MCVQSPILNIPPFPPASIFHSGETDNNRSQEFFFAYAKLRACYSVITLVQFNLVLPRLYDLILMSWGKKKCSLRVKPERDILFLHPDRGTTPLPTSTSKARPKNAERLLRACGSPSDEAIIMQELRGQGAFACWQALRDARADLEGDLPRNFGDCVDWAKRQFHCFFQVPRPPTPAHPFVYFFSVG